MIRNRQRRCHRFPLDGRATCLADGGAEPSRGIALDISDEGIGLLLLDGELKRGTHVHLTVMPCGLGKAIRLEGEVAWSCIPHELGELNNVGVVLAEGGATQQGRTECLACARPTSEERSLSICDLIATYDWRADCSKFALVADNVALPIELRTSGLSAVVRRELSGTLCVNIFGSSLDISQPTLCCWAQAQVESCRPIEDLPSYFMASFRFVSCAEHTRSLVNPCFALYEVK